MNKLTKEFQSGEVLKAQDLNSIKDKINELVEGSNTESGMTIDSSLSTSSTNPVQNKVISEALNKKVEKENGKGLSTNDFDNEYKSKVDNMSFGGVASTTEKGFFVVDADGKIAFKYDAEGFDVAELSLHFKSLLPLPSESGKVKLSQEDTAAGYLANKIISSDGSVIITLIDSKLDFSLKSFSNVPVLRYTKLLEINHIISYGQSLGEGDGASPIITSSAKYDNLIMFNQGVNSNQNTTSESEKYKTFSPHAEMQWGTKGESPAAGCAEQFCLCANLNQYKKILSSNASMGAMKINQLSKGSTYYARIITDITNACRMAKESGKSYNLLAVTWTQGEYDLVGGTSKDAYKSLLKQLRLDLINDLNVITGQNYSRLPFVMYQMTSTGTGGENRNIAHAMYELSIEEPCFYLATPIYMLEFNDGTGGWHIKNTSSKLLGSYYGYVLSEVIDNPVRKSIHPISSRIDGNVAYVKFHVPVGKLAFDTPSHIDTLGSITNHGFSIQALNESEMITAVELSGDDEIKFTCKSSPAGRVLRYGQKLNNASRGQFAGELHDTNTVTTIIAGEEFKLWNWCPIFDYQL
nr:MAG TPA: carbohydrate esterase [Caudoviricetes sp.]